MGHPQTQEEVGANLLMYDGLSKIFIMMLNAVVESKYLEGYSDK
jgi:hypothetical protein